jgi:hypothetical protein
MVGGLGFDFGNCQLISSNSETRGTAKEDPYAFEDIPWYNSNTSYS